MHFRPSRLRFILIRGGFCVLILLILWQIRTLLTNNLSLHRKPVQIFYWQEFPDEKNFFNKEQRLIQIELIEKQKRTNQFNWTRIFQEIYTRKVEHLHQHDGKNFYKMISHIPTSDIPQKTFEIFEETPVGKDY